MFTDKNGRPISPNQIGEQLKQAMWSEAMKAIEEIKREEARKLADAHGLTQILCPQHGTGIKNIRLEPDAPGSSRHHLVYDECCPTLVELIDSAATRQTK